MALKPIGEVEMTPMKAIRQKCLNCSCYSSSEVEKCPIIDCSLYPFRSGHNPNIKRGANPNGVEALRRYQESKQKGKESEKPFTG